MTPAESSNLSPSVVFNNTPGITPPHPLAKNPTNPVVFFDISIGGQPAGRIIMELHADTTPKTAENFRQFCTGEYRHSKQDTTPVGYKNCSFHRIIKDFMCQGGDFIHGDGSGCLSIYGPSFEDESFELHHDRPGLLSMANSGTNTNGCQFFITLNSCEWLDGKHVVFGAVLDGMLTVRKMESVPVDAKKLPKLPITITQCGEL